MAVMLAMRRNNEDDDNIASSFIKKYLLLCVAIPSAQPTTLPPAVAAFTKQTQAVTAAVTLHKKEKLTHINSQKCQFHFRYNINRRQRRRRRRCCCWKSERQKENFSI